MGAFRGTNVSFTVSGLSADKTVALLRSGFRTIVRRAVLDSRDLIKVEMRKPKHGLWYPRPNGRWHRASAPGEAPAVDSGRYINSLAVGFTEEGMRGSMSSDVPYGAYLETGTRGRNGRGGMAARPHINPVADRVMSSFYLAADDLIDNILGT